jgi:hypothetical protein
MLNKDIGTVVKYRTKFVVEIYIWWSQHTANSKATSMTLYIQRQHHVIDFYIHGAVSCLLENFE